MGTVLPGENSAPEWPHRCKTTNLQLSAGCSVPLSPLGPLPSSGTMEEGSEGSPASTHPQLSAAGRFPARHPCVWIFPFQIQRGAPPIRSLLLFLIQHQGIAGGHGKGLWIKRRHHSSHGGLEHGA